MTGVAAHASGPARASRARRKVVLYNPHAVFFTMPLALVTIGSHLDPERYEVVIIDARLESNPVAALTAHLDDALCLGVTVLTGAPIRDAIAVSRAAKAYRPNLPVIWGGWHPSLFGQECFDEPSVDIAVQGQGEETLHEVVGRLAQGESLEGCQGCTYRTPQDEVCSNLPRPLRDLNAFRTHDYSLLDVEHYFTLKGKRQLDYISSQGCAFRCAFCADPFVYHRRWLRLQPARMGEEIGALWQRYHFDDVNFQDETFFSNAPRVLAIAEEFLRRQLPMTWAATMRADQCWRMDEEIFATCKASGLRRVLIGVESGSQDMLTRIQKDITLEQVFFAAERCKKFDIAVNFPFIVGFPGESDASVQATIAVAKRLRAMSPKFQTPIFYFKPYPGTSITHEAVQEGFTLPSSLEAWADFDFVGSIGPWVSPEKYRLIEAFKFYQDKTWGEGTAWQRLLRSTARWRLRHDVYTLPLEKAIGHWMTPPQVLS
jgi:anaerobic magnesium-protoporphyrin IX monomethyl ester cyclase